MVTHGRLRQAEWLGEVADAGERDVASWALGVCNYRGTHQAAAAVVVVALVVLMVRIVRSFWRGANGGELRPSRSTLVVAVVAGVIGIASAVVSLLT